MSVCFAVCCRLFSKTSSAYVCNAVAGVVATLVTTVLGVTMAFSPGNRIEAIVRKAVAGVVAALAIVVLGVAMAVSPGTRKSSETSWQMASQFVFIGAGGFSGFMWPWLASWRSP